MAESPIPLRPPTAARPGYCACAPPCRPAARGVGPAQPRPGGARAALADFLERERPQDATGAARALFLSAAGIPARSEDGQLSPRTINTILEQSGAVTMLRSETPPGTCGLPTVSSSV